jgi:hypothetical protein
MNAMNKPMPAATEVFIVIGIASTIIARMRARVSIRNATPEIKTAPRATRQS